jgi:hypothetical protein
MSKKYQNVLVNRAISFEEIRDRTAFLVCVDGTPNFLTKLKRSPHLISFEYSDEVLVLPTGFAYYESWENSIGRVEEPVAKDGVFALAVAKYGKRLGSAWIVWEPERMVWIVCTDEIGADGTWITEPNDDQRFTTFEKAWECFCHTITSNPIDARLLMQLYRLQDPNKPLVEPQPQAPKPSSYGTWS